MPSSQATCTTPSGRPCEDPTLRPINWPICPIIDSSSTYGFVTLRGGGMFVVNAKTTPMSIVAEYDKATVRGNGCGGSGTYDERGVLSQVETRDPELLESAAVCP